MNWIRKLWNRIRNWYMLNKILVGVKIALNPMSKDEISLADKLIEAGLIKEEIITILTGRRLKAQLEIVKDLLRAAGYSESRIEDLAEDAEDLLKSGKTPDEVAKAIKTKYAP